MNPTNRAESDPRLAEAVSRLADATGGGNQVLPELDAHQIAKLKKYLEVLLRWRSRVALISTADPVLLVEHHVLDSLHVAPHVRAGARVADIGSGAGFPGIPLAVARPQAQITLIESRRRKANFLREARRQAELRNIEVVEGRVESVPPASFDVIVSRALGSLDEFLRFGQRILAPAGAALAMRGPDGEQDAVVAPGFKAPLVVRYNLAMGRRRTLLVYELA